MAHPSSAAVPLVLYGASFVLDGPKGPRTVAAAEFFVLPAKDPTRENVLQPGEVLETYADIEASRRDLGYQPATPIDVGIPRFVDWFRRYHGL